MCQRLNLGKIDFDFKRGISMELLAILIVAAIAIFAVNKHFHVAKLRSILLSSLVLLMMTLVLTGCDDTENDSSESDSPKTEQITKKEYDQAKKDHKQLVATNKQLDQELEKTGQQRKQLEQATDAQESEAADAVNSEQNDNQPTDQSSTASDNSNEDTIQGGDSQYIIGNVNSHVYHMPGQRGYSMKSKNAVYFSSEQEAINAGYRKAKQ